MNVRQILHLKNDGDEQHIEDYIESNEVSATMQDMADCFELGNTQPIQTASIRCLSLLHKLQLRRGRNLERNRITTE